MASIKLDMTNYETDDYDVRKLADVLHELTTGLSVTFDVDHMINEFGANTLEFTGRPEDLALLIRRYETDPGLRAALREEIVYAPPMPGSLIPGPF